MPPTWASRSWPTTTTPSPDSWPVPRPPASTASTSTVDDNGAVTLADGIAWFDTTIDQHVAAGDHTIVLLRLHAAAHVDRSLPLVFHRSGFGLRRPA